MTRHPPLLALALSTALLAGCQGSLNERNELGAAVLLDVFNQPEPITAPESSYSGPGDRTLSLNRSDWSIQTVLVPVDGTVHGPLYKSERRFDEDDIARRVGLFPTAESALQLSHERRGTLYAEAFTSPAVAFLEVGHIAVGLFTDPIWQRYQSPRFVSKRWIGDEVRMGPEPIAPDEPTQPGSD